MSLFFRPVPIVGQMANDLVQIFIVMDNPSKKIYERLNMSLRLSYGFPPISPHTDTEG